MHLHEAHGMDKEPLDLLGLDVLRRMHSTDHSVTHRPLLSQRLDPEHMADIRSPLQPQHYMHALATEEGDEGHPKVYCGFDVASLPRDRYDGHVSNFVEVVTCQACRDVMEAEGNEPIVPAGSGWAPDFFAAVDEAQRSTIRRDARPSEGDASLLHQMLVGPSSDEPRVPVETLYDAEGNPVEVTVEVEPLAPQEHPIGAYFLQTPNERSLKLHVLFQAMIDGKDVTVPYGLDWKVRARITKIASSGTVSCRRLPGSDVLTYEPDVVEVIDE
jgi:hypothetical protein